MRVTAQDLGARFLGRVKSLKEALVRCEKLAATQAGIISGRQAIERGLSWRGISNLVASGQWTRENTLKYSVVPLIRRLGGRK